MAKATTLKEHYKKARRKEKAIHLIEEKGLDIETAFSRCGLKKCFYHRIFAQNSGGTKLEKAVKKWHILTNRDIVLVNKLVHN